MFVNDRTPVRKLEANMCTYSKYKMLSLISSSTLCCCQGCGIFSSWRRLDFPGHAGHYNGSAQLWHGFCYREMPGRYDFASLLCLRIIPNINFLSSMNYMYGSWRMCPSDTGNLLYVCRILYSVLPIVCSCVGVHTFKEKSLWLTFLSSLNDKSGLFQLKSGCTRSCLSPYRCSLWPGCHTP